MAVLKPWYRVAGCTPRDDLRDNKPLNEADFAVNLDHIKRGESHPDIVKPHLFFQRTYMTTSLKALASGVVRRLAGERSETAAVYNMSTQFGGGKTHALAMLYHLAEGGPAAKDWKGVPEILVEAKVPAVPQAKVAVVVGTEFDPITGRQEGSGPVRKTLWGEIAWQLGGEPCFKVVAEHEAKGIAPGGDVIRPMLAAANGPVLILLDELVNYAGKVRKLGMRDQVVSFLQDLSETARAIQHVVLCVSIPKSAVTEVTSEDEEDYNRLKHMLDRLGKPIMMSAEVEIGEIIRRRLFEWDGLPKEGEQAAQEYAAWVRQNAGALTGIDQDRALEQFRSTYPFHPAAISVFERKWQALPRFQRTRGVLRMLALWVARAYQSDHQKTFPDAVIGLGSAPLDDPRFRAAVFEQLGSQNLEGPVTTDIAGGAGANALRLDKEASESIKKQRLHQKVAATIFFESNGGQTTEKQGAHLGEIKAAVGGPDVNLADVDHVIEELTRSCYYLISDRNKFLFSTAPNVNKILNDRKAAVQPKQIDDFLRKQIETITGKKPKDYDIDIRPFPELSNDIPERAMLTLAVLHPDRIGDATGTKSFVKELLLKCGDRGRAMKSAVIVFAADSISGMRETAREYLAWREIDEDQDTKGRLDPTQKTLLAVNVNGSKKSVDDAIFRAYRYVYLLDKDDNLKQIDLGINTRSGSGLTENLLIRLTQDDIVTGAPNASLLLRNWPAAMTGWATKSVRDAFFAVPALPRLKQPDLIKRTIADGVSRGDIGYARRKGGDLLELVAFGKSFAESDVEIGDDYVILKPEDARKLQEPPRLARVTVYPEGREIKVSESIAFGVNGLDQFGDTFAVPTGVVWAATGGVIDEAGKFTGTSAGAFTVTAKLGNIEAIASGRVVNPADPTPVPGGGGTQMLLWSGEVPTQKWSNLYMKVLTKLANTPGLKLKVSIEAPVDPSQSKTRLDEMRAALRELGLDDQVTER